MKPGVICDGISRDLRHAIAVMDEYGLEHAELQYVGEHEVGDHPQQEVRDIGMMLRDRGKRVPCLSRHIFAGMTCANRPGDDMHRQHMDALKRVVEAAHVLDCRLVRVLSPKKEMILWGSNGAEVWNVAKGAWDALLPLIAPAVEFARSAGVQLAVETGNGTMINSAWTARRLIDDLGAADVLKVLWDPANACWCHERAWPDACELLLPGYVGHIHIKDVFVHTPKSRLEVRRYGQGQLAGQFGPIANALREAGYDGVVSFESVFHPGNGNFEDGFRQSIDAFKADFA